MDWGGRMNYLLARREQEDLRLYAADLLWLDVKRHYDHLPRPSEAYSKRQTRDTRTAEEIIDDTINGIGR